MVEAGLSFGDGADTRGGHGGVAPFVRNRQPVTAASRSTSWLLRSSVGRVRFAAMGSGSRKIGVVLAAGVMVVAVSPARGALWSVHQTPFSGLVSSVSCVSAGACIAVGGGGSPGGTDAMGWDGRRWRLQATPEPRVGGSLLAQGGSGLGGVS